MEKEKTNSVKKQKFHERELLTKQEHKKAAVWVCVGLSVAIILIGWFANFKSNVMLPGESSGISKGIVDTWTGISNTIKTSTNNIKELISGTNTQVQESSNTHMEDEEIKKLEDEIFPELTNFNE